MSEEIIFISMPKAELLDLIKQAIKEALPQPEPVKSEDPKGYENIAKYLRVSKSTVQKLVEKKRIPTYKNGKSIFLNVAKYEDSKR